MESLLTQMHKWFAMMAGCRFQRPRMHKLIRLWSQLRFATPASTVSPIRSMLVTYSWRARVESCVLVSLCAFASSFLLSCRVLSRRREPIGWGRKPREPLQWFREKGAVARFRPKEVARQMSEVSEQLKNVNLNIFGQWRAGPFCRLD